MEIIPVTSANLKGIKNVSFEGKRQNENKYVGESHNTMPIKAIPVIALIAMSPLTNVPKAYAAEPEKNVIEMTETPKVQDVQQSTYVMLPSNCKIIKRVRLNEHSESYFDFNLIDTDNDNKNYEEIEFKHVSSSSGHVLIRGIVKVAKFYNDKDGKYIIIGGILLDKNDVDNYAPQGVLAYSMASALMYDAFNSISRAGANHHGLYVADPGVNYIGYYYDHLKIYKQELGIK